LPHFKAESSAPHFSKPPLLPAVETLSFDAIVADIKADLSLHAHETAAVLGFESE